MSSVKEIKIKNGTYYFSNDMVNIKNLDPQDRRKIIQKYSYLLHWLCNTK